MPTHVCFTKLLREEKFTRHRKFILRAAEFLLELHFLFSKQRLCILFEYFVTLGSLVEWKLEFWRFIKGMRGHYPEKHVFGEYIERRGKESLWKKNSSSMRLAFILDSMLSYTRKNNNLHIKNRRLVISKVAWSHCFLIEWTIALFVRQTAYLKLSLCITFSFMLTKT